MSQGYLCASQVVLELKGEKKRKLMKRCEEKHDYLASDFKGIVASLL